MTNTLGNNNEEQTGPSPQRGQVGEAGEAGARAGGDQQPEGEAAWTGTMKHQTTVICLVSFYLDLF